LARKSPPRPLYLIYLLVALYNFLFLFYDLELHMSKAAAISRDCSRKGHEMFRLPIKPSKAVDEDAFRGSHSISRFTYLTFHLPSPFLLAIVLVFVVLPLVWPESDDPALALAARTVFPLATDVTSLAISADAQHLAATCRDQPLWVWSKQQEMNWREALLPEHRPGGTRSLCLSPDGMTLAAGNVDGTISLWETATGKNCVNLRAGTEMIPAVVFSPDGARLACSSTDSRIRIWDLATQRLLSTLVGHRGPVTALAFSPGGRLLASGGEDQTVRLWDTENPQESVVLHGHNDVVLAVTFSPDGELVASTALCDRGVQLWDVQQKVNRGILHGKVCTVTCMAFARDSQTLVTGDEHGTVTLWDVGSLNQKTMFPAHQGWVKGLAVSANGKTLVTGGNDGLVKVWDLSQLSEDRRRRL
jgi:WD40 repeat protein